MFRSPALILALLCGSVSAIQVQQRPEKTPANTPKCETAADDETVISVSDGTYDRCAVVKTPADAKGPVPLFVAVHGATASSKGCTQHAKLGNLAVENGIAMVCLEAVQDIWGDGGEWDLPQVSTDETGTRCEDSDSIEMPYLANILAELKKKPEVYDTDRVFFSGMSMGAAGSQYFANCLKIRSPQSISAFATINTGLKVKGDGLTFGVPHDSEDHWGECDECQYFPIVPQAFKDALGFKACINDSKDDAVFQSSVALAKKWRELGLAVETNYYEGDHNTGLDDYFPLFQCLDDGTGRLLAQ